LGYDLLVRAKKVTLAILAKLTENRYSLLLMLKGFRAALGR
jgi:hypothetical protein